MKIIDDYMFTSCVYEAQILHARTSPVPHFAYLFSYRGQEAPSFTVLFEELVKRSGFNHPILNTGNSDVPIDSEKVPVHREQFFQVSLTGMNCSISSVWLV